jgi:hypothetical protein
MGRRVLFNNLLYATAMVNEFLSTSSLPLNGELVGFLEKKKLPVVAIKPGYLKEETQAYCKLLL